MYDDLARGLATLIVIGGALCAVAGWAVIEGALWIVHHLHWVWA